MGLASGLGDGGRPGAGGVGNAGAGPVGVQRDHVRAGEIDRVRVRIVPDECKQACAIERCRLCLTVVDIDERAATYLISFGARATEVVNERSLNLEKFQGVEESTLDLYAAVRNAYLQKRAKAIQE